jgi:hypothetical protein
LFQHEAQLLLLVLVGLLRLLQVCLLQVCLLQVCLLQVCLLQVCLLQVCLLQVCLLQACLAWALARTCVLQANACNIRGNDSELQAKQRVSQQHSRRTLDENRQTAELTMPS